MGCQSQQLKLMSCAQLTKRRDPHVDSHVRHEAPEPRQRTQHCRQASRNWRIYTAVGLSTSHGRSGQWCSFLKQALGTSIVSCQYENMLPYLEMSPKLCLVFMPLQAAIQQAHMCTRAKTGRCQSWEEEQTSYRHSFSDLGTDASKADDSLFSVLQEFVCAMYSSYNVSDVNNVRSTLFRARYNTGLPQSMLSPRTSGIDPSLLWACAGTPTVLLRSGHRDEQTG